VLGPFSHSDILAYHDTLAISARLQRVLDDVAPSEVHLFAYLSCLLSLYDGWPAGGWGYSFATTENGYPFSADIDNALKMLSQESAITHDLDFFRITDHGLRELNFTSSLDQQRRRLPFIDGACASALALPLGLVRSALLEEPELRRAIAVSSSRWLLEESGVALIHEHFEALRQVVGGAGEDRVVPAVVWLNYLAEAQQLKDTQNRRQ
jgi:hypothetical protein